ncbi:ParB N-terminal domain-containing protein [Vibrio sp. WZ-1]|uniref:ParB/Srx family N-terminal domain-containing protein n=1 Tax=Vibrio sp. WZ-1 TaxID=3454501 RepID=UPI003F864AB0
MEEKEWWEKRVRRSVDYLKLWKGNPRFDGDGSVARIKVSDFADAIISTKTERDDFYDLVKSIVKHGFRSFDPVVVWRNEDGKYTVAEGNRRVLALKLLRQPHLAPSSIRQFVRQQAAKFDKYSVEKIPVCLAPNYEEARWYILERHAVAGATHKRWDRLQQMRYIVELYDFYEHDADALIKSTNFTRKAIFDAIRFVTIRDWATDQQVLSKMTIEEKELIHSKSINITVLERWFTSEDVKQAWGISFNEEHVTVTSNRASFLRAYAAFLKLMFAVTPNDLGFDVNTRSIPQRNKEILNYLPDVHFGEEPQNGDKDDEYPSKEGGTQPEPDSSKEGQDNQPPSGPHNQADQGESDKDTNNQPEPLKKLPPRNRLRIIDGSVTRINAKSKRINAIFYELTQIPVKKYTHVAASSLRVLLDLSVDEYIRNKKLESGVSEQYKNKYEYTVLMQRLKYIQNQHVNCKKANKCIGKLLQPNNEHSLDTLNSYVHGHETHKCDAGFVNSFWDMLAPLMSELIDMREH